MMRGKLCTGRPTHRQADEKGVPVLYIVIPCMVDRC